MAVTISQLRAFWAAANARSFTKASKQLGISQVTISQHVGKLEEETGTQLFRRGRGDIALTDAGSFLMDKTSRILGEFDEALAGIGQFASGVRGVLSVGLLSSVARNLLPDALQRFGKDFPAIEIDILEVSPAEVVDLLYARRLSVGVVASDSIASSSLSFAETELFADPYVLAVPKKIDLSKVSDPEADLTPRSRKVLNNTIRFEFGNQHKRRIDEWYQGVLPNARVEATTRTYEVALSMVQAGLGVAVVPALTAEIGPGHGYKVNLYHTSLPNRRMVAITPEQYAGTNRHRTFIEALAKAGQGIEMPRVLNSPFLGGIRPAGGKKAA